MNIGIQGRNSMQESETRPSGGKENGNGGLASRESGGSGSANGNGSGNNKNLSHVPCKFFKQGNCQAGTSCPFSHNLDGSLAADKLPCKYFQKGNCKFGLKCALAHFLPDGTRVNAKGSSGQNMGGGAMKRRMSSTSSSQVLGQFGNHTSIGSLSSSQPIEIGFGSLGKQSSFMSPNSSTASSNAGNVTPFVGFGSGKPVSHMGHVNSMDGPLFSQPSFLSAGSTMPQNSLSSIKRSSSSQMLKTHSSNTSPISLTRSPPQYGSYSTFSPVVQSPPSTSNSYPVSYTSRMPASQNSVSSSYHLKESLIVDDDSFYDESAVFEEDYVPGSLGDLILTPQELQRRDSRSQSGTLFSRPNLNGIFSPGRDGKEIEQAVKFEEKPQTLKKSMGTEGNRTPSATNEAVFVME